jgi:hypothetical protein
VIEAAVGPLVVEDAGTAAISLGVLLASGITSLHFPAEASQR